ncbi:MAG: flagellar hook capping FlgD N-terminal domain-containing protein [Dinoroseobacter sp.]|nr:flagellar hook capping FlgD N-terminal domain-containing protein [Dinoroseobacter sp.]
MESISPIPSVGSPAQPTEPATPVRVSSDYETFLLMLTTQLENQDPTDPADADDLAVQLATFSGVEQQTLTNDLLSDMLQQSSVSNLAQLGSWVGMDVLAPGPIGFVGNPIELEIAVPPLADKAELVVYNSSGAAVERAPIDDTAKSFVWSGKSERGVDFPLGLYRFEVEASRAGQPLTSEQVTAYRNIAEVRMESGETLLIAQGGERILSEEVRALRRD